MQNLVFDSLWRWPVGSDYFTAGHVEDCGRKLLPPIYRSKRRGKWNINFFAFFTVAPPPLSVAVLRPSSPRSYYTPTQILLFVGLYNISFVYGYLT